MKYLENQHKMENIKKDSISLINSYLGYNWFEKLYVKYPLCFVTERIKFWFEEDGKLYVGNQAKVGSAFLYMGENVRKFRDVFETIGRIILPCQR